MSIKVSVITATYNAERFISRTVASILSQTYTNFEWIVVDDGSRDATLRVIDSYAKAFGEKLRVIKISPNTFGAIPLTVGVENAKGSIIVILDHDDELVPTALEEIYQMLEETRAFDQNTVAIFYETMAPDQRLAKIISSGEPLRSTPVEMVCRYGIISENLGAYDARVLKDIFSTGVMQTTDTLGVVINRLEAFGSIYYVKKGLRIYNRDNPSSMTNKPKVGLRTLGGYIQLYNDYSLYLFSNLRHSKLYTFLIITRWACILFFLSMRFGFSTFKILRVISPGVPRAWFASSVILLYLPYLCSTLVKRRRIFIDDAKFFNAAQLRLDR